MQKKVMIVDDDSKFLEELKDLLSSSGCDVAAIGNVNAAVDMAVSFKPDVILFDLKMPDKNGFLLADELKRHEELMRVPVIAMTGIFYGPMISLCGIKRYIEKPFTPLSVISEIEGALKEA